MGIIAIGFLFSMLRITSILRRRKKDCRRERKKNGAVKHIPKMRREKKKQIVFISKPLSYIHRKHFGGNDVKCGKQ